MAQWLKRILLALSWAVLGCIALVAALVLWVDDDTAPELEPASPATATFPIVDRQAKLAAIDRAGAQSADVASRAATEYGTVISEKKQGVPAFAKEVTSLYGRALVVQKMLPFTKSTKHEDYVREQWAKHVISQDELDRRRARIMQLAQRDLDEVQNRLIVSVRDERFAAPPWRVSAAASGVSQAIAIGNAASAARADTVRAARDMAFAELSSQVVMVVLTRIGVAAGFITAGASQSWWTAGASIVVGIAASIAWEKAAPPQDTITVEVNRRLDELRESEGRGVHDEVADLARQRMTHWKKTLEMQP